MTRVAVVTGAGRGIGLAVSVLLGREGWRVVPVDRAWPNGHPEGALEVDLADTQAVRAALNDLARVDLLVNNAALQVTKPIEDTTAEEWDATATINVRAAFVCLQALIGPLAQHAGAVVNVGSVHALATSRGIAAYAASKGALLAFTRAAALELAEKNIRVNAVLPGAVDTALLRAGLDRGSGAAGRLDVLCERTPLQRLGRPEDIAQAVLFLADSERSGFITGQSLIVDGGALARLSTE